MRFFRKTDDEVLGKAFLEKVRTGTTEEIGKILKDRKQAKKLSEDCLFIALIGSLQLGYLDTFNILHDYLTKNGQTLDERIIGKMFNALCQSDSSDNINNLRKMDERFHISHYMMKNISTIEERNIVSRIQFIIFIKPPYESLKQELQWEWSEHGLLLAIREGKNELIDYLLSINVSIPSKLLEWSFITACREDHFNIASTISSKMDDIANSEIIQEAIAVTFNEKQAHFVSKLIFKHKMDKELGKSNKEVKKTKI